MSAHKARFTINHEQRDRIVAVSRDPKRSAEVWDEVGNEVGFVGSSADFESFGSYGVRALPIPGRDLSWPKR